MFFSGLFQRKSDAPVTTPAELAEAIGLSYDTYTGKQISSQRAMRLTAVFSCVRVLAESVGMLPCNLYHLNGSLKQRATGERLHKLISTHPNGYMTPQEFWELVVTCLCLRGNFYAYKVKAFGEVAELLPVDPGCVVPKLNSSWEPVYQVTFPDGSTDVLSQEDSHDDVVMSGAFAASLRAWSDRKALPALLWQHRMDEPIGVYTEMKEDDVGLYVRGRLLIDDDPLAKRAHAHMKAGSLTGLSIGYVLKDWEYDRSKEAFLLKEIDLWEVSLVTFPSNDEARISDVKNALARGEIPEQKKIERVLRDVGLSRTQAKAFMAGGYGALSLRDAEDVGSALNALKNLNF
ncbi:HK97 family phage prohead protease [Escherichia coli]|nr:HK97 family phage prohead protease [Escherichia coli]EFA5146252.1 HK97 family phage prohead protease [Escherichia coli]EFE4976309.1 HK97 family phage prohead protease [Escherichia coli]EHB7640658.1 HK97 family phage prohead protease [Escherichia coli]EJC3514438.1 HK97 family phage prohead protease [Escherichia coli]